MIRSGIACLMLFVCAGTASAQLAVRELEKQTFDWDFANLFSLDQGDLLLRMRGHSELFYVLAPDGKVRERLELPPASYGLVAPYRKGFAIQRFASDGSRAVQIVAYESLADAAPNVLYETRASFHSPRLYAAPNSQDLYLLDEHQQQMQITRIDSSGQIAWQKAQRGIEWSSFVATDDGVAFAQYIPFETPTRALRALDREGRLRWEMPLDVWDIRESVYSAAGFITLLTDAKSEPGRHRTRLVNFDARTGQLTGDAVVEPFFFATGTKDGLLIGGWLLGQGYVATLDRKGEYVWRRRYVPDDEMGDVRRGAMTRNGQLVFVTRGRVDPRIEPTTSVVVIDGTAAALGTDRGGCLALDWEDAVEPAALLELRGILVAQPTLTVRKEPRCTDRETQYIAFVKELGAAARGSTVLLSEARRQFAIRVTAAGEPIRLEDYSVYYGDITGGGTTLMFAVAYDGAGAFWKLISTKVVPHLDRMDEFERHFTQLTGCAYVRDDRSRAGIDDVLSGLENAARVLNQRIAKIAPEQVATIKPVCGASHFVLRRDGFGTGDNAMFPLAEADRTFLEVVRRARETAGR